MHIFPTNSQTLDHNKKMLKYLNTPVVRSIAEGDNTYSNFFLDDEQLERIVYLCNGKKSILTSNRWVLGVLLNGSLGEIISIFYKQSSASPQLPTFIVVEFPKYIKHAWDETNPIHLPIPTIKINRSTQIPLKMGLALTIHKSQGMTLPKATIDIRKTEQQGLTHSQQFQESLHYKISKFVMHSLSIVS